MIAWLICDANSGRRTAAVLPICKNSISLSIPFQNALSKKSWPRKPLQKMGSPCLPCGFTTSFSQKKSFLRQPGLSHSLVEIPRGIFVASKSTFSYEFSYEPPNLLPQNRCFVRSFHQFSAHLTKCHACHGICTLSPLDPALTMRFCSPASWRLVCEQDVKGLVACGKPTWLPQIWLSLANSMTGLRSGVLCCPPDVLRSDFKCLPEAISGRSVQFAASLACCYLWFRSCNRAAIAPRRTASSTGPDKYSWAQSVNRSALVQMWLEHPDQEPCWSYPQSWKTMTNGMRCCFALLLSFHLIPRPSSFKCHMRTVGGRIVITRWSPVHADAQRDCNCKCVIASIIARPGFARATANQKATSGESDQDNHGESCRYEIWMLPSCNQENLLRQRHKGFRQRAAK